MKDLTQGSIAAHLVCMAVPVAGGMLFQTLYYFVDLFFVARLGATTVAGVSAAGNFVFIILALTQVIGVGTVAVISHAIGRKDQPEANLIFNQSLMIATGCGVFALIAGYAMTEPYLRWVSANDVTVIQQGGLYLYCFLPGIGLQFAMVTMTSALSASGVVKPAMLVQSMTVLLNAALAPFLIAGWGTGYAMGAAGAGLASTIAVLCGVILLWLHYRRSERYVTFHLKLWRPQFAIWKRILVVGLPAGGEFLLIFIYTAIAFWAVSNFGPAAQAGFGIGSRIIQAIFLPAMAIAFVVAPIAGQNYGARQMGRVRATFRIASMQSMGVMLLAMLLCQWQAEAMVRLFSAEREVVHVGALFLHLISWNFMLSAVNLVCSGVFQALGSTIPSLLSSTARLIVYSIPTIWLTSQPRYQLQHVFYISILATVMQAALSLALLQKQMRLQLGSPTVAHPT